MPYTPNALVSFARPIVGSLLPHFTEKLSAEKQVLGFDMSSSLPVGVTLQSVAVDVTCAANSDPSPMSILDGAAELDASAGLVTVPVMAGIGGVFYVITISCTTNSLFYAPVMTAVLPVI